MPVDERLLQILCCPVTKTPVKILKGNKLRRLNEIIDKGSATYVDGTPVETPLEEGLITEDESTIYRVDDGIPVMLKEKGIQTSQLDGF
ncbi:MAG: Trm112 family protein [Acidobacteriota bacterium]